MVCSLWPGASGVTDLLGVGEGGWYGRRRVVPERACAVHGSAVPVRFARSGDLGCPVSRVDRGDVLCAPDLLFARSCVGDSCCGVFDPYVHRLPRLRPRLVRRFEASERAARRHAWRSSVHALCVVAAQTRRPSRDRRRSRPERRRRHPDADGERIPGAALVGSARLQVVPQPVGDVRARSAMGRPHRPASRHPLG
jgi:hypothetical protein